MGPYTILAIPDRGILTVRDTSVILERELIPVRSVIEPAAVLVFGTLGIVELLEDVALAYEQQS